MRITVSDAFDAPIGRVEEAVLSDGYQEMLSDLPNVAEREVREQKAGAKGRVHRVIYYKFGGTLPGPAAAVVGGETVSWDEESDWNPDTHTWDITIKPHVAQDKFSATGTMAFIEDGETTVRRVEVDVEVKVPFVGRLVEKVIADGMKQTMQAEADKLREYLENNS